MLDTKIKSQLQTHFSAISHPVQLVINLDESKKSIELQQLATELSELNSFQFQQHSTLIDARRCSRF